MLVLWAGAVGCGQPAPPGDDPDGDGVVTARDCAPADPTVAPGMPEVCDGVDQNCDGVVDEGLPRSTWYVDADGDGFGAPGATVQACAGGEGLAEVGRDCNDADAAIWPGAPERCDGADHDCDGEIWELDSIDVPTWYVDADTDGYGDDARPVVRCLGEEALARVGGDCDDSRADVSPTGREVCDATGADEDCDGLVESDDPDAVPDPWWYVDADRDLEGGPNTAPATSCVPPRGFSWSNTDCDDADAAVFTTSWYADGDGDGYARAEGAERSCVPMEDRSPDIRDCDDRDQRSHPGGEDSCGDGVDSDCNGVDCFLAVIASGTDPGGAFGTVLGAGGDVTGDGVDDLVIGYLGAAPGGAVIYPGPIGPEMAPGPTLTLEPTAVPTGMAITLVDIDGDGQDDLGLGTNDLVGGAPGLALVRGPITRGQALAAQPDRLVFAGTGTAAGDLDTSTDLTGDGEPDFVVGYAASEGAAVFVVDAGFNGEVLVDESYSAAILASDEIARLGWSHATGSDLDGDGVDDLVFGVDLEEFPGESTHMLMVALGPVTGDILAGDVDVTMDGSDEDDPDLGGNLHILPDLDGDGLDDIVASSAPSLVVVSPPAPGSWTLWQRTRARVEGVLEITEPGDFVGGDFDMDLRGDIAVACDASDGGAGVVRVFSGPFDGTVPADEARAVWSGSGFAVGFGARLENVGDLDGGGRHSIAITAANEAFAPPGTGLVYLLQGLEIP